MRIVSFPLLNLCAQLRLHRLKKQLQNAISTLEASYRQANEQFEGRLEEPKREPHGEHEEAVAVASDKRTDGAPDVSDGEQVSGGGVGGGGAGGCEGAGGVHLLALPGAVAALRSLSAGAILDDLLDECSRLLADASQPLPAVHSPYSHSLFLKRPLAFPPNSQIGLHFDLSVFTRICA